jgi:hypothetical protein
MYIQYMQGLDSPRLNTADHVPSFVAYTTSVVETFERWYASPPTSLSPLNFLCREPPCPILRTLALP